MAELLRHPPSAQVSRQNQPTQDLQDAKAAGGSLPTKPESNPERAKSVLMLLDSKAHWRVRFAMMAMLLVAIVLLVGKAVQSERMGELSVADNEIIAIAAEQSLLTERIGLNAALLSREVGTDRQRVTLFDETLVRAQAEAHRMDDVLREQGLLGDAAHPGFKKAYEDWLAVRDKVWLQARLVITYADQKNLAGLQRARAGLEVELLPVVGASDALLAQARQAAQTRSRLALNLSHYWTGLTLLLLTLVTVSVTELAARSVQRRNRALASQTAEMQRLALVAEHTSNGVAITGASGQIVWVNPAFVAMHGFALHEIADRDVANLQVRPQTRAESSPTSATQASGNGEQMIVSKAGMSRWFDVDVQPYCDTQGAIAGWVAVHTDIDDQVSERQLLTLAIEGAALGSWQFDFEMDEMSCNDRLLDMLGSTRESLGQRSAKWNALIHPDDLGGWFEAVATHMSDQAQPPRRELRLKSRQGHWVWVMFRGSIVMRAANGKPLRMSGICMDISAQKLLETQLRDSARTDGLTQMPNRSVVMERVQRMIERSQATPGYHFAVLFMDFDRFKQVNDTLGHGAGDELLRQIAQRLELSLRPGDAFTQTSAFEQMAARMGGDEFVVVLDDIRGDLDAEIVAGRLVDVLAEPYAIGENTVNSSVSIGIVTSTHAGGDVEAVLRDADIAMYEAKRAGRGRYAMFEPAMHKRARDNVALENDLREALARQELFVVHQPLVDLATGALAGMEALVRWKHPVRGMVSPVEFVPVAEAVGLIGSIGQFVLRQACGDFARLARELGPRAPATFAVNLSRAQLRQPGLALSVLDVLREFGVNADQLILEVTESLAAQDNVVKTTLQDIRALGVALSLDDFGTGYSSLSCLHELPVNTVKIDRSFVSMAQDSDYHRVLIEATIRMAQTLGLSTVAEGIETQEQAELMLRLGCGKGQGYLFSKPLEFSALVAWMARRPLPKVDSTAIQEKVI